MAGTRPFADLPIIVSKRKREMLGLVNDVARAAATAGGRHVTFETPVKRGVARSNWVGSLDTPFTSVIPAYHPIMHLGSGPAPIERKSESENANAAIQQQATAINRFDCVRNRSIHITNNTPYIGLLANGHSRQSGPGWFEQVLDVMVKAIVGRWRLSP